MGSLLDKIKYIWENEIHWTDKKEYKSFEPDTKMKAFVYAVEDELEYLKERIRKLEAKNS